MKENKNNPLILVFYIDANFMENKVETQQFIDSINLMIERKNANIMAFFIPTDKPSRIECINPVMLQQPEIEKINEMIAEIKGSFQIDGNGLNNTDEENVSDN